MNRQPWQQGLSLLVMTALLSGCAGFGPERPSATLLTPAQLALSTEQGKAPVQGWWQQLQDPTLNQLISDALQKSPSLRLAQDRLREAQNTVGISESQLGPQFDLNAIQDRQRYSTNGIMPAPIGGEFYNSYTLSLNASWEIDFWGKHRAETRAAVGEMRASAWEAQQSRLVLTQAVIAQYTALQRQSQQQQITQARIQIAQSRISLIQARVHAGLLSADMADQAQTGLASLLTQNAAISGDIQRARHALAVLCGQEPTALDQLTPTKLNNTPKMEEAGLSADLLGRRPDIASQRERVEAMEQNVKAAHAEFYPNISLSALAGVNSLEYGTLFDHASRIVDFSPAISLPLFHSGQLQSNLHREQTRYDQAVDSYNQALLDGLKDAADALSSQQQASAQLIQARHGFEASQKSANAMTLRLRAGMVSKLDVLDSQDNALVQKSTQLDAQASTRLAWAKLNTALGGGLTATVATR